MSVKIATWTAWTPPAGKSVTGYKIYSDQDGEVASVGLVLTTQITLSDGVSHNVTCRAVYDDASLGLVSNVEVVDLSNILMQDDFAGVTLSVTKWDKTDTDANVQMSQNEKYIWEVLTPALGTNFTSSIRGKTDWTGVGTRCLQVDCVNQNHLALICKIGFTDSATLDNQIYISQASLGGEAKLVIRLNNVTEYNFETSILFSGNTFKVEMVGTAIKYYYYNAGWVQLGTTQTFDFVGKTLRSHLEVNNRSGGTIGNQVTMDNFYETNAVYSSAVPV